MCETSQLNSAFIVQLVFRLHNCTMLFEHVTLKGNTYVNHKRIYMSSVGTMWQPGWAPRGVQLVQCDRLSGDHPFWWIRSGSSPNWIERRLAWLGGGCHALGGHGAMGAWGQGMTGGARGPPFDPNELVTVLLLYRQL